MLNSDLSTPFEIDTVYPSLISDRKDNDLPASALFTACAMRFAQFEKVWISFQLLFQAWILLHSFLTPTIVACIQIHPPQKKKPQSLLQCLPNMGKPVSHNLFTLNRPASDSDSMTRQIHTQVLESWKEEKLGMLPCCPDPIQSSGFSFNLRDPRLPKSANT